MLSAPAITLLLSLHSAAIGRKHTCTSTPDRATVDELRESGLAVKVSRGLFLTAAGVHSARVMKGETPTPLAELQESLATCE